MRLAGLATMLVILGVVGLVVIRPLVTDRPTPAAAPTPARPGAGTPAAATTPSEAPARDPRRAVIAPPVAWRHSRAVGLPQAGRLRAGVQLPAEGRDFFTWDPIRKLRPNRGWRRWGTNRLVRTLLAGLRAYRRSHPRAPRVGIGDLSRPHGGAFGARFGGLGHASHQNGLDADVYYPRRDRRERRPPRPRLVDQALAQALVDAFVRAGAELIFVGPHLKLSGPPHVVQPLVHHDDHLHVRIR